MITEEFLIRCLRKNRSRDQQRSFDEQTSGVIENEWLKSRAEEQRQQIMSTLIVVNWKILLVRCRWFSLSQGEVAKREVTSLMDRAFSRILLFWQACQSWFLLCHLCWRGLDIVSLSLSSAARRKRSPSSICQAFSLSSKSTGLTWSNVCRSSAILAWTWDEVAWLIRDKISSMECCKRKRSINWSIHSIFVASRLSSEKRLNRREFNWLTRRRRRRRRTRCVVDASNNNARQNSSRWSLGEEKEKRKFASSYFLY